jgi:hypothetical protein
LSSNPTASQLRSLKQEIREACRTKPPNEYSTPQSLWNWESNSVQSFVDVLSKFVDNGMLKMYLLSLKGAYTANDAVRVQEERNLEL